MSLLAYARKLQQEKTLQSADGTVMPFGSLTGPPVLYPELRYADIEGIGTVEIDATGNVSGHSPSERCQDPVSGEKTWIPTERCLNFRNTPFPVMGRSFTAGEGTTRGKKTAKA